MMKFFKKNAGFSALNKEIGNPRLGNSYYVLSHVGRGLPIWILDLLRRQRCL